MGFICEGANHGVGQVKELTMVLDTWTGEGANHGVGQVKELTMVLDR